MQGLVGESCRLVKTYASLGRLAAGVCYQHAAEQVLIARHPELDAMIAGEPARAAGVVGVQVCDEDPGDGGITRRA